MKRDLYFSKPLMNAAGSLGFAPIHVWGSPRFLRRVRDKSVLATPTPACRPTGFGRIPGRISAPYRLAQSGIQRRDQKILPTLGQIGLADHRPSYGRPPRRDSTHGPDAGNAGERNGGGTGFAPLLANDIILLTLEMCAGEVPLIFSLPVEQVLGLGPRLIQQARRRSVFLRRVGHCPNKGNGSGDRGLITGRLYGPSLFPRHLKLFIPPQNWGFPSSARAACGQKKTPRRCSRSARWRCRWMQHYGESTG